MFENLFDKFWKQEFVLYIINGIIVTVVSWLTYTILENLFRENFWRIANFISIIISIIVAYFLNRKIVFKSKNKIFPEIFYFFLSRFIISLIFEHGTMELLITGLQFNYRVPINGYEFPLAKAIGSIFVVLANYLVGKYLVFRTSNAKPPGDE